MYARRTRATTIGLKQKKILKTNTREASEYFFAIQECNLEIAFV